MIPINNDLAAAQSPSAGYPAIDGTLHKTLLRDLNELWSLPRSRLRESRMQSLILLIDSYESLAASGSDAS